MYFKPRFLPPLPFPHLFTPIHPSILSFHLTLHTRKTHAPPNEKDTIPTPPHASSTSALQNPPRKKKNKSNNFPLSQIQTPHSSLFPPALSFSRLENASPRARYRCSSRSKFWGGGEFKDPSQLCLSSIYLSYLPLIHSMIGQGF